MFLKRYPKPFTSVYFGLRSAIAGLEFTYEPELLRFFQARFATI